MSAADHFVSAASSDVVSGAAAGGGGCAATVMMGTTPEVDIEDVAGAAHAPLGWDPDPETVAKVDTVVDQIVKNREMFIGSKKQTTALIAKFVKAVKAKSMFPMSHYLYRFRSKYVAGYYGTSLTLDDKDMLENLLGTSKGKSHSGVVVLTVTMSPFPGVDMTTPEGMAQALVLMQTEIDEGRAGKFSCEYNCFYCPMEPGQARSYLSRAPATQRANQNKFDPRLQMFDRINALISQGNAATKFEIIVEGGTLSSYPKAYVEWFMHMLYYAANTAYDPNTEETPRRQPYSLEEEMRINETALGNIIGLTIETRPDKVTPEEMRFWRRLGVTRVQIGVQHDDPRILRTINRRCDPRRVVKAIEDLKNNCFKVDIHLMPDLPQPLHDHVDINKGEFELADFDHSVDMPTLDREMLMRFFTRPEYLVDDCKIYPCSVVDYTVIKKWWEAGFYKPYGNSIRTKPDGTEYNPLFELLCDVMPHVPYHIRINRVDRDWPKNTKPDAKGNVGYAVDGNMVSNIRQIVEDELHRRGTPCKCIRCREVKGNPYVPEECELFVERFEASRGTEYYMSVETKDRKFLHGHLRLRESDLAGHESGKYGEVVFPELEKCFLLRELHVYGVVQAVHGRKSSATQTQHKGIGKMLVEEALKIARGHRVAVISGNGVKPYYRRLGFVDEGSFLIHPNGVESSVESSVSVTEATTEATTEVTTDAATDAATEVPGTSWWSVITQTLHDSIKAVIIPYA
jgi:ELP3 family radical SAM enzyme/protein acetyltransferase